MWDQSGVASVLALHQEMMGHKTRVIKNAKFDPYGIARFYGNRMYPSASIFRLAALSEARKYDVIHFHDGRQDLIDIIKRLYSNKILVQHYHGSFTRMTPPQRRAAMEKKVNAIIVATPDLLDYEYAQDPIYLPNPVDTNHFSPNKEWNNRKGLISLKPGQTKEQTTKMLHEHGFDFELDFLEGSTGHIPYQELPGHMGQYEYYVDLAILPGVNTLAHFHSLTGLQGLAMGLKVIDWNYNICEGLPRQHTPDRVAKQLEHIYDRVIRD